MLGMTKRKRKSAEEALSVQSENSQSLPPMKQAAELSGKNAKSAHKKLTRREQREAAKKVAEKQRSLKEAAKEHKRSIKELAQQRDENLSEQFEDAREARRRAKDVFGYVGFESMFEDGTCEVERGLWSQTIGFSDISYQAAEIDDQRMYFDQYAEVFNYCGSETTVQMSIVNSVIPEEEIGSRVFFTEQIPGTAKYVKEYNKILNHKMLEGRSNIIKHRYCTFSVAAPTYEEAIPKLAQVRSDLSQAFQRLGCRVHHLNGTERLYLLNTLLRPGKHFDFSYADMYGSGLMAKDYVCPLSIDFRPEGMDDCFKLDQMWGQVVIVRGFGSQIADTALSEIIDLPLPMAISIHTQALNIGEDTDYVKERLSWIDKEITDRQMQAIRKGYDPSMIPQDLAVSKNDAEDLLGDLLYKNQRLFRVTAVIYTYAPTFNELQSNVLAIIKAGRRGSFNIEVAECQQHVGLNSSLPLGHNHMYHERYLTTAQTAMLMPFATLELFEDAGGYYGQNKESKNLIIFPRKSLSAPMGWVLGMPGSGKSFAVKREITNTRFMYPDDEILIIDPNNEYTYLVDALGGRNAVLSPSSPDHINLFDLYAGSYEITGEDPVLFKSESVSALCAEILGRGDEGLTPEEKTLIDRCVGIVYERSMESETAPTLQQFYEVLQEQPDVEAKRLVVSLELYVTGSLRYFNSPTTVDIERGMTCFSFKQLGVNMRTFAMLIILDFCYNRMLYNFERGITTWLYIDEAQSLFGNDAIVEYFNKFWSEGRKFNLIPTAITQTIERVLTHKEARYMVSNSDFLMILKESDRDRELIASLLSLSTQQEKYISRSVNPGEGLLCIGGAKVPFEDDFPQGYLYDLWNTKPEEIAEKKRALWQQRKAEAEAAKGQATDEGKEVVEVVEDIELEQENADARS